jgi:hypothetical protein
MLVYVVRKSEKDGRILGELAGPMEMNDAFALCGLLNGPEPEDLTKPLPDFFYGVAKQGLEVLPHES